MSSEAVRPPRFPPGEILLERQGFGPQLLAEVDALLGQGACQEGKLELEAAGSRLTCLIRHAAPFLAGLAEGEVFSRVPLRQFIDRARQLSNPTCRLQQAESPAILMEAVHYCQQPDLRASTRLVSPAHILQVLSQEKQNAAVSLELSGSRTLLFLKDGQPARLYFGRPEEDPGRGELLDRLLAYAFSSTAPQGTVEVFTSLKLDPDPEAGSGLERLAELARPCPPTTVSVRLSGGRELSQRPFTPPALLIGRDPTCDLWLDNLAVSRRHARLAWESGRFLIEDLGSANGTRVGGKSVGRAELEIGDQIQVGKFLLVLMEATAPASSSRTLHLPSTPTAASLRLVGEGVDFLLDRDLLLGRGAGVDVKLRGFFVRPVHARISTDREGRARLTCLGGSRVRINGRKTGSVRLAAGDRIEVGGTRLALVSGGGSGTEDGEASEDGSWSESGAGSGRRL